MSTRRATRATSKAASSRGASPAVTESDVPATPSGRRSRRAGSTTPLPAVAGRSSTAYGTNTTTQPASLKIPEPGEEVNNVLNNIFQPQANTLSTVREEDSPGGNFQFRSGRASSSTGRRSARGPNNAYVEDRSFGHESYIFGNAGLESSSVASPVQDSPPTPVQHVRPKGHQRERQVHGRPPLDREQAQRGTERTAVAQAMEDAVGASESLAEWSTRTLGKSLEFISYVGGQLRQFLAWITNHLKKILLASAIALIFLFFLNSGSYRWYGLDFKHNVGQFVPDFLAQPGSTFSPSEIRDLQSRVKATEYEIAYLKKRGDIDEKALSNLKDFLPDHVIVKRTKSGKLEITQDFWHALTAKMRTENADFHPAAGKTSGDSTAEVSLAQIDNLMEKSKLWDRYLQNNRAQLKAWAGEEFDDRFLEKFKDSVKVSKSEFVELVRENWEDSQDEIKKEIRRLSNQFDEAVRHIESAGSDTVGYNRDQIKAISTNVFRSLFSNAQLEVLAKANKNLNIAASEHRLNHFSPLTGAMINPKLTSPNYIFPSMNRNFVVKTLARALFQKVPQPNPPVVALQKWDEHGECWCSPSKDQDGFGPSLAVTMGNHIYPDQIIIEHIPSSGSLEPGAAPKEMELLAYIEDLDTYHTIKQRSKDIFYGEALTDEPRPFGFVRIATWTYDFHSVSNIQSFPLQIELGTIRGPSYTNKLIVRSKNNWGDGEVDYTCLYRVRVNGETAKFS